MTEHLFLDLRRRIILRNSRHQICLTFMVTTLIQHFAFVSLFRVLQVIYFSLILDSRFTPQTLLHLTLAVKSHSMLIIQWWKLQRKFSFLLIIIVDLKLLLIALNLHLRWILFLVLDFIIVCNYDQNHFLVISIVEVPTKPFLINDNITFLLNGNRYNLLVWSF